MSSIEGDPPALDLELVNRGKVRDVYSLSASTLLFVTSDRISAHDVVMNEPIPNKGRLLNAMTDYWFDEVGDVIPNHLATVEPGDMPEELDHPYYEGRITVAKKASMLPLECIVRGYITGSAWKEYNKSGTVHGMSAPANMLESEEFSAPMFTPSTKAEQGEHDENISYNQAVDMVGREMTDALRDASIEVYRRMRAKGGAQGIIVADTKLEFGLGDEGLVLCDEVGTPDSSRFWPSDNVWPGSTPPSFDKQPLRDYLDTLTDWNRKAPAPTLPLEVVLATSQRYQTAYERITGLNLAEWPGLHVDIGNVALGNS